MVLEKAFQMYNQKSAGRKEDFKLWEIELVGTDKFLENLRIARIRLNSEKLGGEKVVILNSEGVFPGIEKYSFGPDIISYVRGGVIDIKCRLLDLENTDWLDVFMEFNKKGGFDVISFNLVGYLLSEKNKNLLMQKMLLLLNKEGYLMTDEDGAAKSQIADLGLPILELEGIYSYYQSLSNARIFHNSGGLEDKNEEGHFVDLKKCNISDIFAKYFAHLCEQAI